MSNIIRLTEKEVDLFEKLATHLQTGKLSPAPAKVLALLTVSPIIHLSFNNIMETLNMSKSATSVALTQLKDTGQIEYSTKMGDRKRYFTLRTSNLTDLVQEFTQRLTKMANIFEEIVENRPSDTAQFNENLRTKIEIMRRVIGAFATGNSASSQEE